MTQQTHSTQPGWHYGWNVVATTLVFQAVTIGILIYCFALFVVPWLETFQVSRGEVMIAITVLQLGVGLLSPLVGRAMDVMSIRWLVICGALAMSSGMMLASQATAMWQIIMLYALVLPLGMAMAGPLAAQTLVTRWFLGRRGVALGISAIGTSIGGFSFPFLTGALLESYGWRVTMQSLAVLTLVLVVPLSFWVLRRQPPALIAAEGGAAAPAALADARDWKMAQILRTPMFWIAVCGFLPINAAFGAIQFNLGAYSRDLGFPTSYAALLISLSSAFMIAGKFAFGAAADRVDHRRLYYVMATGMAASLLLLIGAPGLVTLIVAASLMGLAGGGILTLMAVIYGSRFGAASFGRVMGLGMMFITLAALGPLLSGWIHDVTGSYNLAFGLFAVLLIPAAAAVSRLPSSAAATEPAVQRRESRRA
ncbi:MAG: MFS transporter [Pseudomonadales bacterium]